MRYVIEYQSVEGGSWNASGNTHSDGSGRHLRDIDFPSLEAAQREAVAQATLHPRIHAYRARDTQPELGTQGGDMPVAEQGASPRAVRIYRRNREWVVDMGGRTPPVMSQLHPYLSPSARQSCRDRGDYSIVDSLIHGVSPQILTSALSAWMVEHPNGGGSVVMEEGVSELASNSAYLAMGDFIYKMVPVRQVSSSKAVRVMREKVRVEIERVREGLRQQASQEAQQVITQANQRAATIRAEAQAELDEAKRGTKFPAWTNGLPVRVGVGLGDSGQKFAMQRTQLVITELSHGNKRWPMNPERKPIRVNFWLPLSGLPGFVRLEEDSPSLPHVTYTSCCLTIGENILPINNIDRLRTFSAQVTRAFSVINLASLLEANMVTWNPEVVALLPAPIKRWLEIYTDLHTQRDSADAIRALPPTDILERTEETWSVR